VLRFKNLGILILVAAHVLLLIKLNFFTPLLSGKTPLYDFDYYYRLSSEIKAGINPYTVPYLQTLGPPLVILYFLPFSYLPLSLARGVFTSLALVSGYLACYLLAKKYFSKQKASAFLILASLFFSSFPTRLSIELGQSILPIVFLLTVVLITKSPFIQGFFLAVASGIKTFLLITLLSFIRKKRETFIWTLVVLTSLFLVSLSLVSPEWYRFYLQKKLPGLLANGSIIGLDYYNQSIRSTLHRLFLDGFYLPLYLSAAVLSSGYLIAFGNFEAAIILAVLLSPISWQHYFALLFPVLVVVFSRISRSFTNLIIFSFALFLWWIEFPWLHHASHTFLKGFLASHYFLSGMLIIFLIFTNRKSLLAKS
jgi:hypothetical protein